MLGRVLVRFPAARSAIAEADLLARLEKDQLWLVAQDRLYTMCVAASNDSSGAAVAELLQIRENADRITRNRAPVRLPDEGVEIQYRRSAAVCELVRQGRLARARIADDCYAHEFHVSNGCRSGDGALD